MVTYDEIYDVKIGSLIYDYGYNWTYIVNDSTWLKLVGAKYQIKSDGVFRNDCRGQFTFRQARTTTRGCFDKTHDHYYYLTYTDTSDFACGFADSPNSLDYQNIGSYSSYITRYDETPLEFVDEVEIEYIKFIYNYRYAYYKINNLANGKSYYGIIDTKKNIVVFNTDKEILTWVPYSDISMLAITSSTAYEICVIKRNGACIDSYDCTDTNKNYIVDLEGNKCADSCESGKIYLIRENMCGDTCDESIYVLSDDNRCGLCKTLLPSTPYKLINTTGCLSADNIPENAEVYNSKLYLLKCKNGYKLEGDTCVLDCYETCETCSEYSDDESDQKCTSCKENYNLENGNCINAEITIPSTEKLNNTNEDLNQKIGNDIIPNYNTGDGSIEIKGDGNTMFQVTTTDNELNIFSGNKFNSNGLSVIILGKCEDLLKQANSIDPNLSLIIKKVEQITISAERNVQYEVYHPITKKKIKFIYM